MGLGRLTRIAAAGRGGAMEKTLLIHVYIAGPISKDPLMGTRAAVLEAHALEALGGFACFVPQLSILAEMIAPRSWAQWMEADRPWLAKCDALLRLPGESKGANQEIAEAGKLGIPVFYSRSDLLQWAHARRLTTAGAPAGNTVLQTEGMAEVVTPVPQPDEVR
jgi:hypothetical protein